MWSVVNKTKQRIPHWPWTAIATAILGEKFEGTLVFTPATLAKKLNHRYRHKDYVPNILSFPLSKKAGDIFITPTVAKREAKDFDHTYRQHLLFLFIHGLLHLKGLDHGSTMERKEREFFKLFLR
jgi:probable rRNA maturation factor